MLETQQTGYTEERPWGSFTILDEGKNYKVKRIEVKSNQRLSLQYHYKRAENWTVIEGTPLITVGEETKQYRTGQSVYIPIEAVHRLENATDKTAAIIEVQNGDYLGEDDIVRVQDDYKRDN